MTVAEKTRRKIHQTEFPSVLHLTATIGVASFPENALDAQALFLRTDEALYQAKEAGRNRSVRSSLAEPNPPAPNTLRGRDGAPRDPSIPSPQIISPFELKPQAAPEATPTPVLVDLNTPMKEQVDGHTVIRRLGTGGMGEVLLVRQPDLDRVVALKRPLSSHLTPEQMRAFEQEAKVTASLDHPGVITVHTMGRDMDGRRYYTMKPSRANPSPRSSCPGRKGTKPPSGHTPWAGFWKSSSAPRKPSPSPTSGRWRIWT